MLTVEYGAVVLLLYTVDCAVGVAVVAGSFKSVKLSSTTENLHGRGKLKRNSSIY